MVRQNVASELPCRQCHTLLFPYLHMQMDDALFNDERDCLRL